MLASRFLRGSSILRSSKVFLSFKNVQYPATSIKFREFSSNWSFMIANPLKKKPNWSRDLKATETNVPAPVQEHTPVPIQNQTNLVNPQDPENPIVRSGLEGVLDNDILIITREIEWGTLILGWEQANKYSLKNQYGQVVGYLAEESSGFGSTLNRQLFKTRRNFKAAVFDVQGTEVLKIHRPMYLVTSSMFVEDAAGSKIGEVHMRWHLMRRKYDLVLGDQQFASIDQPMLDWDFELKDEQGQFIGSVNKDWRGIATELFTDANQYIVRLNTPEKQSRPLSLYERAITLSTAVTIDCDYFSRHSRGGLFGPSYLPIPIPGGSAPTPSPEAPTASPPSSPTEGFPSGIPTSGPTVNPSQTPRNAEEIHDVEAMKDDEVLQDPAEKLGGDDEKPWTFEEEKGESSGTMQVIWDEVKKLFED